VRHVHAITKNTATIGRTSLEKILRKILTILIKILKTLVKRKFDQAYDLNWKLLDLEMRLKRLDDTGDKF
jgi:hypothetical protein